MLIIYRQLAHRTFAKDANNLLFDKKQTIRDRNKAQEKPLKRAPGRPGPENAIWTTAALTENDKFLAANFFQKFYARLCPPLLETLWWLVWLGFLEFGIQCPALFMTPTQYMHR